MISVVFFTIAIWRLDFKSDSSLDFIVGRATLWRTRFGAITDSPIYKEAQNPENLKKNFHDFQSNKHGVKALKFFRLFCLFIQWERLGTTWSFATATTRETCVRHGLIRGAVDGRGFAPVLCVIGEGSSDERGTEDGYARPTGRKTIH